MSDEWRVLALGEAVDVVIGRQRSPKHATGSNMVPYLRAANVKDGHLDLGDVLEMNFTLPEQEKYRLLPGDVLVTEGCGTLRKLGAASRWQGDIEGVVCFQNTLLRLRAVAGVTVPGFVDLLARWAYESGAFAAIASGTNIFHIGSGGAAAIPVAIPPIDEQRRIVDLVASIDHAAAEARRVNAAASRSRSVLVRNWFEGAGDGWQVERLGDVADVTQGSALPKSAQGTSTGDIPWFKIADLGDPLNTYSYRNAATRVSQQDLDRLKGRLLPRGSVAFPRVGGAVLTERKRMLGVDAACDENHLVVLPNDTLVPGYTLAFFENLSLGGLVQQGAVPSLNQGLIRDLRIPVPDPDTQRDLTQLVDALRTTEAASRRQQEALDRVRTSVLSSVMDGDHRIPHSYDALMEAS